MNTKAIEAVEKVIVDGLRDIVKTKAFKDWLASQQIQDDDIILINNSFIYRTKRLIKTNKNNQFIGVKIKNKKLDFENTVVAMPSDFNGDFKIIKSKQASSLSFESLNKAIRGEIGRLGQLIFFLIGEINETSFTLDIQDSIIGELKYDPTAQKQELVEQNGEKIIVINQLVDPEAAWNLVKPDLEKIQNINIPALEKAYAVAYEKLQSEARLMMDLPKPSSARNKNTFIAQLRNSVAEQRRLYELALNKCVKGKDSNDVNLREVMRIAYNFADDAIKLIQLLVSVSDLKAIILWSTLKSHIDLAESIRNLPWTKSEKKASPDDYIEKVKGARNHAFHNLLLFDRTIEADLSGVQVNAKKLTLLPAYGQRKSAVPLDYEDREIVEILSELTRASETVVSLDFWVKNSVVLESFEKLLESTEEALWMLNSARK